MFAISPRAQDTSLSCWSMGLDLRIIISKFSWGAIYYGEVYYAVVKMTHTVYALRILSKLTLVTPIYMSYDLAI